MLINTLKKLLPFLSLAVVVVFVFKDLPQTFYQQDEWNGLGLALAEGSRSILNGVQSVISIFLGKGRLISNGIFYLFLYGFPFQNSQMAIFAIFLHLIATSLVYFLVNRFLKNSTISFLGALFFAVNSVSHGAVTWPFVATSAVGSSIFVLLATLFFFRYIDTTKTKWLFLAGLLLYLSLWFKETGLYMFIFLPFATLIFKKYEPLIFLKKFWLFLLPFLLIVGYRVLELRLRITGSNLYITGNNDNFFLTLIIRAILYPLTSFSLMFVPGNHFIEFAREVVHDNYPFFAGAPNFVLIAQSAILDILAVVLTGFIIFVIFLFLRKEKSENINIVIFWLAFSLFSFIPYIVLAKDFSYLESRYYYVSVAGGSFLLAWLLQRLRQIIGKVGFLVFVAPLYVFFLWWHVNTVRAAISEQVVLSNIRNNFIIQLREQLPTLNAKKNIFYVTSDKNYWADTNMLPFQQGSGYTLMVLYYYSGKIPSEFLKNGYLFEIGSQGYKESGDLGFGFFWNKEELTKAMETHKLPENSIIYLSYNSKKESVTISK
ncbi:MAG: glycosyltransferase family 39 protein [Candidatus Blackburnbacteria bacterium]|nr:glycosyltransferase family 39 protein [Candidatus Blackburnbacteria bacterium]